MYMHAGCCEPPVDDCFGCYPNHEPPENIELVASGFSWLMPESQTDAETSLFSFAGGSVNVSATTHNTRSRPFSLLNGTKEMRRNPNGACQWVWNDVRTVASIYRHGSFGVHSPTLEETVYEPLNATDPTSPWFREILPVDDARCSVHGWFCDTGAGAGPGLHASLSMMRITVTDPLLGYFTTNPAGSMHWVLLVSNVVARSAINTYLSTTTGPPINCSSLLVNKVTPVTTTMQSAYNFNNLTTGVGSVPPYRYAPSGTFFERGGGMLHFIKEVDCDADFLGDAITLSYAARELFYAQRAAFWDITFPATVEVTI